MTKRALAQRDASVIKAQDTIADHYEESYLGVEQELVKLLGLESSSATANVGNGEAA